MAKNQELIDDLQEAAGNFIRDNKPLYRAVHLSRGIAQAVQVMQEICARGERALSTGNIAILQAFPQAVAEAAAPGINAQEDFQHIALMLDMLRPQVVRQEIAESLLADFKSPLTGTGLMELGREAPPNYATWKKAFDKLVKSVGIERNTSRGGYDAPKGVNPDGVESLSVQEMKLLASFASDASRQKVQSTAAQLFLAGFYKQYAPLLMEIVQENSLRKASTKLTDFWQKHVDTLVEMIKDSKYTHYKQFVDHMNQLADHPNFGSAVCMGMARGDSFKVDGFKLARALEGNHPAGTALPQLAHVFHNMERAAGGFGHRKYESQMRAAQSDYLRNVAHSVDELRETTRALAEARAAHAAGAQYRAYS